MTIRVPAPSAGTRIRCHCGDCQTAACLHDPEQDLLMPTGATNIWHTTPDLLSIDTGIDGLRISRLSPRGTFRWYAGCCGTLMFGTVKNLKIPFVGVTLRLSEQDAVADLLGPVRCNAFTESARPHPDTPRANNGVGLAGVNVLRRAILTWASGQVKSSPLMRPDGTPIAPVEVITRDARKAARPKHLR